MTKTICLAALAFAFISCTSATDPLVAGNFDFAGQQLRYAFTQVEAAKAALETVDEENPPVSPRNVEPDGSLHLVAAKDWTSGFFPGELWYMYEYTREDFWAEKAREYTAPIEREKLNGRTHDMGFKVYCCFGNGFRLTGDEHYRDVIVEAATTLATRFSPVVGATRSWDHNADKWDYPVIIDNMMNLELLFAAWQLTGDSLYYNIAVTHALTTMRNHFRPDYSSYHVIGYDPATGGVVARHTHQGYSHDSAWARGQAWGVYGYTMCYRFTQRPEFLEQAKHIAGYIFNNPALPEDLIPYWDYNAPDIPAAPRDVSAATVTASALYELAMYDKVNAAAHTGRADKILENVTRHYRAPLDSSQGFLLLHSTGSLPHGSEIDVPIVYADYYFLEALLRKQAYERTGNAVLE